MLANYTIHKHTIFPNNEKKKIWKIISNIKNMLACLLIFALTLTEKNCYGKYTSGYVTSI